MNRPAEIEHNRARTGGALAVIFAFTFMLMSRPAGAADLARLEDLELLLDLSVPATLRHGAH